MIVFSFYMLLLFNCYYRTNTPTSYVFFSSFCSLYFCIDKCIDTIVVVRLQHDTFINIVNLFYYLFCFYLDQLNDFDALLFSIYYTITSRPLFFTIIFYC